MSVIRPQRDLFETQPDLFDGKPAAADMGPDLAEIRRRLHAMLDGLRGAERMPWGAQDARVNAIVFPQMANWLPEPEREALRAAFAEAMARLSGRG